MFTVYILLFHIVFVLSIPTYHDMVLRPGGRSTIKFLFKQLMGLEPVLDFTCPFIA